MSARLIRAQIKDFPFRRSQYEAFRWRCVALFKEEILYDLAGFLVCLTNAKPNCLLKSYSTAVTVKHQESQAYCFFSSQFSWRRCQLDRVMVAWSSRLGSCFHFHPLCFHLEQWHLRISAKGLHIGMGNSIIRYHAWLYHYIQFLWNLNIHGASGLMISLLQNSWFSGSMLVISPGTLKSTTPSKSTKQPGPDPSDPSQEHHRDAPLNSAECFDSRSADLAPWLDKNVTRTAMSTPAPSRLNEPQPWPPKLATNGCSV